MVEDNIGKSRKYGLESMKATYYLLGEIKAKINKV